ncbi:MAG: MaoC family dehydratase N-terminal domain-containing protein [Burkholderiaceae bacterium]|nr:MaoC family dehydratase N-terminal domain-containing protein [Burkholderiaceae bacterium]
MGTDAQPGTGIADFGAWIGRTETTDDPLAVTQARAAAAMFDDPAAALDDGSPLPPLWHWFYFLPRAAQSQLDDDGHPRRGGFVPPIPYPRRMFAGSTLRFHRPLALGRPAQRHARIADVAMKSGRSGSLAFVTVALRFEQDGALCIEEEQQIVYREPGSAVPAPAVRAWADLPAGAWSRVLTPDPRLLFRFSALTFNAHRIHYDRDYARDVEGYPGLVVHGPLTAMLLADLAQRGSGRPLAAFSFRGQAPLFDLTPLRLVGTRDGDGVRLEAQRCDGQVALAAGATLG